MLSLMSKNKPQNRNNKQFIQEQIQTNKQPNSTNQNSFKKYRNPHESFKQIKNANIAKLLKLPAQNRIQKLVSNSSNKCQVKDKGEEEEMNRLYEQNLKLGYRINSLKQENNFYRISINNIEKLNKKIHKHLDGAQLRTLKNNQKKINTHLPQNTIIPFQTPKQKSAAFKQSTDKPKNIIYEANTTTDQSIKAALSMGSLFQMISNKIHIKNLQLKVGNDIRKTQKLKKVSQGSIPALKKKTEQLELEVNKLARQAEYYQIESEMLTNIYKADYYLHLNEDWFETSKNKSRLDSKSEQKLIDPPQESDQMIDSQDDKYIDCFRDDPSLMEFFKLQQKKCKQSQKFGDQFSSHLKNEIVHQKNPQSHQTSNKNLNKTANKNQQKTSNKNLNKTANKNQQKTSNKNLNKKCHPSRIPMQDGLESISSIPIQTINYGKSHSNSTFASNYKNNKLLGNISNNLNYAHSIFRKDPNPYTQTKKHMTEKQLFLLPDPFIQSLINQLYQRQTQQSNKLQSLRKEQKQQAKTYSQLLQTVTKLKNQKQKLKTLIDQEFSALLVEGIRQTHSQFLNNRKAINNSQTNFMIRQKQQSRTLVSTGSEPFKNSREELAAKERVSKWMSIEQRKQEADQLQLYNLYEKQLMQSIERQDRLLQEQQRINQELKHKILDGSEQENKELKALQQQVVKRLQEVKDIKSKYHSLCQTKEITKKYLNSFQEGKLQNSA